MAVNDYYWIGARDAGNNDTFVWVGTGEVLPGNSPLWGPREPAHGSVDCAFLYKLDGKLYNNLFAITHHFVCESV